MATTFFSVQSLLTPLHCSPLPLAMDALDLSRKRSRSRSPTPERGPHYPDPPHAPLCFSSPSSQAGSESSSSDASHCSDAPGGKAKLPRPFKAYPKDPMSLAYGVVSADAVVAKDSAGAYADFRQKMLARVQSHAQGTNVKMRRTIHQSPATASADPTYWEKRRKNNEAAKRSRDARRAKEDEIAIRCAFLEQENLKLRFEMTAMRHEMERMRGVLNVPTY